MSRKPSIKTIAVKWIILISFLFTVSMVAVTALNFRTLIQSAMTDKGLTLAHSIHAGLSSLMLSGTFTNKEELIQQADAINGIEAFTIIRHASMSEQFGLPEQAALKNDPHIARAFATGLPEVILPGLFADDHKMRIIFPLRATQDGPLDCASCHHIEPNAVLAALDFQVDMEQYMGMSLGAIYILCIGFLIALSAITFALFRVIDATVKQPLEQLMVDLRASAKDHAHIDADLFESLELEYFADQINHFNQTILKQNAELADYAKNLEGMVAARTRELGEAYALIRSSIDYASHIQRSVLPDAALLQQRLADHFILWRPRDVVGGDLYWVETWGDETLIILGDCTGHGVPGAFMTLIATGAMQRAKHDVPQGDLAALITRLHCLVQMTLRQHGEQGESDDGLELGACLIAAGGSRMTFVGARFELYAIDDGALRVIKGTKSGIGYRGMAADQAFAANRVELQPGLRFYMTSDGLTDQIGGAKQRMFGKKRLRELLLEIHTLPMAEQAERLEQALVAYQGEQKRRDDVSVIGWRM
ncbi:SpoIIE family protein phosphatase [Magnetofaba australis]|nr:SpoIIE family protein phosphatase [Magnetofaba australis]